MGEQSREEQCLRKAEEYVKEHDIQRIVKDCIVQLCIHRPDNPYSFLRQHFASLEKVCIAIRYIFLRVYSVSQPPPLRFSDIFPKFNQFFTSRATFLT